jgi:ABC-type transport system involved in multi-copper enzyme maturation permease subunit
MLRHAFRLHRWGWIGYGAVLVLGMSVQASAFTQIAGTSPVSRARFAHEMSMLAAQLPYLFPAPFRLDTLDGYVQWRAFGPFALVVMIWSIAAAAGAVRRDEDRELVDCWLAAGVSRTRLVASRLAAFGLASLVATVLGGLGYAAGAARYEPVNWAGLAGKGLTFWLLVVTLFALCFLVAQLGGSLRAAQAAGAVVAVALLLPEVMARIDPRFDGVSWVSPFRWYDATTVLAPGGRLDVTGVVLSIAVILTATALSAVVFAHRDVRGPLVALAARHASAKEVAPSSLLTLPVARLLHRQRWVVAGWTLAIAAMAVFMVGIAHSVVDSAITLPGMREILTHGSGGDPYRGFIGTFWFGFEQLLLAGFAIHLVSGWAADDTEGILASVLSMPVHRSAIVAERAAAALLGTVVIVATGSLVAVAMSASGGTALGAADVLRASWPLIPFTLTYAAVGAAASADFPRAAVGVLGVLAFLSFLVYEVGPLERWPAWANDLSVQRLYGTPFLTGVFWTGLWTLLTVVGVGFGLAMVLMQRREVGG